MANAEMQLVSRIVRTGELASVIDWGITDRDFRTVEAQSVWKYIAGYYQRETSRGSVIGPNVFANVFPQLQLYDDPSMTTEALCHEVRRARIVGESREAVINMVENVDVNPTQAIAVLHSHMQQLLALGEAKNHDIVFGNAMEKLLVRYNLVKNNQYANARLLWAWPIMNEVTGGIQEADFIIFYGRPKSMKTWGLACCAASAYEQGKTALIYTKEMTPDNIFDRTAACIARLPYQELRSGKLMAHDEASLHSLASWAKEATHSGNLICLDGQQVEAGGDTVAWLQSKVEKYKPHVVFIDGMYLLSDSSSNKKTADWQRVTNISRAIRSMILRTKIPVIATMQANRAAAKHGDGNLDEIAYADAIGQDATVAIRTIVNKSSDTISMILAGSREFKLHGFSINGKPATDFSFLQKLTEEDVRDAERAEAEQGEQRRKEREKARKPRTRQDVAREAAENERDVNQQLRNNFPS